MLKFFTSIFDKRGLNRILRSTEVFAKSSLSGVVFDISIPVRNQIRMLLIPFPISVTYTPYLSRPWKTFRYRGDFSLLFACRFLFISRSYSPAHLPRETWNYKTNLPIRPPCPRIFAFLNLNDIVLIYTLFDPIHSINQVLPLKLRSFSLAIPESNSEVLRARMRSELKGAPCDSRCYKSPFPFDLPDLKSPNPKIGC